MSQSDLHMGLYYVGCWIESAALHLVHQPDNWQQLLDREFQSLHAMQQIHATHPTAAIPAPAVQGLYHISCKNLHMALQDFNMQHCSMSTNIPTFFGIGTRFWKTTFKANGGLTTWFMVGTQRDMMYGQTHSSPEIFLSHDLHGWNMMYGP
ncbi:hypothetical protein PAXRUDRAFT_154500 [Paxillus rubicundulus Ve08.2h10]|uniref:Uncharacterized protein n=1 Tax=Paxillus rubicundulus Ve08.2h10 TaxID=930991 RepID=A0A0D0CHD7_9AGAM|nr:hypothetical protein PAXRUDRAFT_154500 [Paxillus rubicundulus Ve08.2h10]